MADQLEPDDAALCAAIRAPGTAGGLLAKDAFERLYQRYARTLLAFLVNRCPRSDVDEVSQEAWLRMWRGLQGQFDGANFRAWMFQIARNLLIERTRRRQPGELAEDEWIADVRSSEVSAGLNQLEELQALEHCLGQLEEREAKVFRGLMTGLAYEEICQQQGLDSGAAYKASHSAKQKLKTCVERRMKSC